MLPTLLLLSTSISASVGLTLFILYVSNNKAIKIPFVKLHPSATLPKYQTKDAAGADLHSTETCILQPREIRAVNTGLAVELPHGYELQVRPRSGKALNPGISVNNSPGTVDADYRGEIKVILINHGTVPFEIKVGDRIAQMIIAECPDVEIIEATSLSVTARGAKGFGSTGT